jgi:hypothetical protein
LELEKQGFSQDSGRATGSAMSSGQPRGNLGGDFAGLKFDYLQPAGTSATRAARKVWAKSAT